AEHPYNHLIDTLKDGRIKFFNPQKLNDPRYDKLPLSIRVLLEAAIRNCDGVYTKEDDVQNLLDWQQQQNEAEVPFSPARVLLQDFTGIPAMVDLAAMRDAVAKHGGDPGLVNPKCPTDLIVDHSLQIDYSKWCVSLKNQEVELIRNKERLQFFKWCSKAFKNVNVVPPDVGAVHQVNLEYLSRAIQVTDGFIYPDSVVGTDSHTTMINGLGILGWGVGGIESEAVMLGQPVSLTLPHVVGCKLVGSINPLTTSIDIVLGITKHLRQAGIAGKFVEFFGPGVSQLSVPDRTTIANMCPEYNATVSFFPVDQVTLKHFKKTSKFGRSDAEKLELLESYMRAVKLFRSYGEPSEDPQYSEINLSSIVPCVSGPKRPQDRVAVSSMKEDFQSCLNEKVTKKMHNNTLQNIYVYCPFGEEPSVQSCKDTRVHLENIALKKNRAVEAGLVVKPYIRTSLAPGSGMVTHYLNTSGVLPYFSQLGFEVSGYGCATCVGNTAPLPDAVVDAIKQGDLVACGVLSGNRHFEGRLCNCVRANYLASPPLVVAYALAGTVGIDFEKEPVGVTSEGKEVYLCDIWPSREEVQQTEEDTVICSIFKDLRGRMEKGNTLWNNIECPDSVLFPWDHKSTYIRSPSFFSKLSKEVPPPPSIENAHVLLFLGNKVLTDHISPAGSIARVSAAAKYLLSKRLTPREFNSYGARRGNDAVMTRGTFASIKLQNRFIGKPGPKTLHIPSGLTLDVFEAADRYQRDGVPLIILAGKDYGSGNSRDWVAKGPYLLGVRAVIAESFEKLHKNQLVGMGIMPLQFLPGDSADSLELSGKERFTITQPDSPSPRQRLTTSQGKSFSVTALFDTEMDVTYFRHGGLLRYVARTLL
uniref:Iron responsive element binding protein 2 n=1 Tax=Cyclopterus lumpus TaxID=8103 RepID=A0A8C2XJC8_CYCLU